MDPSDVWITGVGILEMQLWFVSEGLLSALFVYSVCLSPKQCGCYDLVREQTEPATMYVVTIHGQGLSSYLIKSILEHCH